MKRNLAILIYLAIIISSNMVFAIQEESFVEEQNSYVSSSYNKKSTITLEKKSKNIGIRIEGISDNLFYNEKYKVTYTGESVSVLDALEQAVGKENYTALNSYYGGKYISRIYDDKENTFGENTYDCWQYCVNGIPRYDSVDTYCLSDNDNIVIYYGDWDIKYPREPKITYKNHNIEIEFTSDAYDTVLNRVIKPIEGAKVKLNNKEYITDKDGKIYISYNKISNKKYNLQIEKYDEIEVNGKILPLVVRFAEDYKILIKIPSSIKYLTTKKEEEKADKKELKDDYKIHNIEKNFEDIKDGKIDLLISIGVIRGESDNNFYPENNITRAELITLLAKLSREDIPKSTEKIFNDTPVGEWYFNNIMWGYNKGIISGYQNNFEPDVPITREDMAIMFIKYLEKIEGYGFAEETNNFLDKCNMDNYSKNSIANLSKMNLINGKPNNIFDPKGYATRIEAVILLTNFLKLKYDNLNFDIELTQNKYLEYAKLIITSSRNQEDTEDIEVYDLIDNLRYTDEVASQGIITVAYTLIAFNTGDYRTGESEIKLISYIKDNELENGGFSLRGDMVDLYVTTVVLQALSEYNGKEIEQIKGSAIARLPKTLNK